MGQLREAIAWSTRCSRMGHLEHSQRTLPESKRGVTGLLLHSDWGIILYGYNADTGMHVITYCCTVLWCVPAILKQRRRVKIEHINFVQV